MLNSIVAYGFAGASAGLLTLCAMSMAAPAAYAQSADLGGSWSGGGKIVFPSGETERARCRARFRRHGPSSYRMSAVCATPSARVEQVATIRHVSGNVYRGDFFNQEHGIGGSIRIRLRGGQLSASLAGGGGTAAFVLGR